MSTAFIKKRENFDCNHCGVSVMGNGYTNHCPQCLWSKHVDVHPGDRAANCGGMMTPASLETKAGKSIVVHLCEKCGHQKRNAVHDEDDYDMVIDIARKMAEAK